MYGLEFERRSNRIPFVRVRSEDLLRGDWAAIERLLEFMRLRWHAGWLEHADRVVDRWRHHTDASIDPLRVLDHPATVKVASSLGCDAASVDVGALAARYQGTPDPGLFGSDATGRARLRGQRR